MPIVLIAVMYFLMIRPQMKRAKEHRGMLEKLGNGDEVITNGGIAGVVREIGDSFITIEIADNVRVRVQKAAIGNVLPTGTNKPASPPARPARRRPRPDSTATSCPGPSPDGPRDALETQRCLNSRAGSTSSSCWWYC
jgi:preprotein translocase subunit YajC